MRAVFVLVLFLCLTARADTFGGRFRSSTVLSTVDPSLPLLWGFGPQSAQAVTAPTLSGAFCISVRVRAQTSDWANSNIQGGFQLGTTLGAANTLTVFRQSNNAGGALTVRLTDSGGVNRNADTNSAFTKALHSVAACYTPTGGVFSFVDGVQVASASGSFTFTPSATLRLADLGATVLPYGAGVEDVCIAGPSGTASANPTVAVANACGQFTAPASVPCAGCVTPDTGAAKVVALGDSITQLGASVFRPYPSKLNALLGVSHDVTNGGVSGNTCAQVRTRYQSTYKGQGFSKAVVLCGINNIGNDGNDGPTTWAALEGLLDEVRTDGLTLAPVLLTPCASSSFCNTTAERDAVAYVNSRLTLYCTTHGLACVDTSSMGDGASPPALLAAYDGGDGLHESQAGADKLAALVNAALR